MNLRLLGCGALCLTIGVVAGYRLGTTRAVAERLAGTPPVVVSAAAGGAARPVGSATSNPGSSMATQGTPTSPEHAKAIARLEALRWFKRKGQSSFTVGVFSNPQTGELNEGFLSTFGLTPGETRQLKDVLAVARERLTEARFAAAKVDVRTDNGGAVIDIPPLPELGGAAYDEALTTLRTLLGSDRWEYFEELSIDGFEQGFRSFGAMQTRIEIEVRKRPDGSETFEVKDRYGIADLDSWFSCSVEPENFSAFFPFAAKLLPQSFLRTQPKQ